MTTGERIRKYREAKGFTQEDLGKLCNTTKQTIQKYEMGTVTNIPIERVEQIAKYLGTTPAILVGWKEEPETNPIVQEIMDILTPMTKEQLAQVASYIKFVKSQE